MAPRSRQPTAAVGRGRSAARSPRVIDDRWRTRFGAPAIDRLERALRRHLRRAEYRPPGLPARRLSDAERQGGSGARLAGSSRRGCAARRRRPLAAPLRSPPGIHARLRGGVDASRCRSAPTRCACSVRPGTRVRDLPALTGVSREANAMCAGWLERHGCVVTEPDPTATRGKVLRLTEKGQRAQQKSRRILGTTEVSWRSTLRAAAVDDLRPHSSRSSGDGSLASSPLGQGLDALPGQLARRCPATTDDAAALPHGAAPRRLSRRQLISPESPRGGCGRLDRCTPFAATTRCAAWPTRSSTCWSSGAG